MRKALTLRIRPRGCGAGCRQASLALPTSRVGLAEVRSVSEAGLRKSANFTVSRAWQAAKAAKMARKLTVMRLSETRARFVCCDAIHTMSLCKLVCQVTNAAYATYA